MRCGWPFIGHGATANDGANVSYDLRGGVLRKMRPNKTAFGGLKVGLVWSVPIYCTQRTLPQICSIFCYLRSFPLSVPYPYLYFEKKQPEHFVAFVAN